jgi:hypothetical protein
VLDGLVEDLAAARILLLVSYRPEYQDGWGYQTSYTRLRVDSLAPISAHELLRILLGADASLDGLEGLLSERTEGNPFFLEQSVRTLVETDALAGEPGAYRLTGPVHAIQIPASVHAVVAARVDRLPREDKRLLQAASARCALPPRPRHAVSPQRRAAPGGGASGGRARDVPRDGHPIVARTGGGGDATTRLRTRVGEGRLSRVLFPAVKRAATIISFLCPDDPWKPGGG